MYSVFISAQEQPRLPVSAQAPAARRNPDASTGSLREIIPGHYVYSSTAPGRRPYDSGVIVTSEGVVVLDALDSEAIGRAEREAISGISKQPIRYLVSSPHHDQYSKGNLAYPDILKIGSENYRTDLLALMAHNHASAEEQKVRLPNQTFSDRVTLYMGGKEIQILYLGKAHTRGDSIIFVPQDRIAYLSELLFYEQFPNMGEGYGVSWLHALDTIEALGADIFVPGHGTMPADPRETKQELHRERQIFVDARDAIQAQIAQGATEDQTVAAVKLEQYQKLYTWDGQREPMVRRMYRELTGKLP